MYILLIEFILYSYTSMNIEVIKFKNNLEIPSMIKGLKTYEIKFDSLQEIPENLQISINSLNNINQIISFSKNKNCLNTQKIKTQKSDFYLEKKQLSLNKNYICIQCECHFEYCDFNTKLSSGKNGVKLEEDINTFSSFLEIDEKNNEMKKFISNVNIELYTLESTYTKKINIPSDRYQYYKIDSGSNAKYKISSGKSVTVTSDGIIYPKNTTWYWYGGMGYSSPISGKEPTSISTDYTLGTSVVTAIIGGQEYKITVTVKDYASEYVEAKFDSYINTNVTNKVTQLDQLRSITAFPAQFPYSASYSGYTSMAIFEAGDCWASASTIKHLCDKVGIIAHVRFAANDGGSGSGHRNVVALIGGKIYICEAGYGYNRPNRPYYVNEEIMGYSTTSKKYGDKTGLVIYQYDGYLQEIDVPSVINGKEVIGLEKLVFYNGPGKTATKITIPETIKFLGNSVFNSLPNITEVEIPKNVESIGLYVFAGSNNISKIEVDSDNQFLTSKKNILYNKNKTTIINYPPGKVEEKYEGLSSLERFENYSFYYTKNVSAVVVPKSVKYIGEGAFGDSNIKEIYFAGDPPILGEFIFHGLNVTIYYPEDNEKWKSFIGQNYTAKVTRWVTWDPPTYTVLIVCLSLVGVLIIAGIILFFILRKKGKLNSFNFDFTTKLTP